MKYTELLKKDLFDIIDKIELKERKNKYNMIISKEVKDRDGETVLLSWLDVKNYKKNPVVLIDHKYTIDSIVWKTTKIKVDWKNLIAEFNFIDTENWKLAEKLYEAGLLKASSIWFLAKERDNGDYTKITKSELLEWSLVAVPANAEALSLDEKTIKKAIDIWLLTKWEEEDIEEIKTNEFDEIKKDIKEIKNILKSLADDKAEKKQIAENEAEIKAKKELLQAINKGISDTLYKIKSL